MVFENGRTENARLFFSNIYMLNLNYDDMVFDELTNTYTCESTTVELNETDYVVEDVRVTWVDEHPSTVELKFIMDEYSYLVSKGKYSKFGTTEVELSDSGSSSGDKKDYNLVGEPYYFVDVTSDELDADTLEHMALEYANYYVKFGSENKIELVVSGVGTAYGTYNQIDNISFIYSLKGSIDQDGNNYEYPEAMAEMFANLSGTIDISTETITLESPGKNCTLIFTRK